MLANLDESKHTELVALTKSGIALFSDVPTRTHLTEHDVDQNPHYPFLQYLLVIKTIKK